METSASQCHRVLDEATNVQDFIPFCKQARDSGDADSTLDSTTLCLVLKVLDNLEYFMHTAAWPAGAAC